MRRSVKPDLQARFAKCAFLQPHRPCLTWRDQVVDEKPGQAFGEKNGQVLPDRNKGRGILKLRQIYQCHHMLGDNPKRSRTLCLGQRLA